MTVFLGAVQDYKTFLEPLKTRPSAWLRWCRTLQRFQELPSARRLGDSNHKSRVPSPLIEARFQLVALNNCLGRSRKFTTPAKYGQQCSLCTAELFLRRLTSIRTASESMRSSCKHDPVTHTRAANIIGPQARILNPSHQARSASWILSGSYSSVRCHPFPFYHFLPCLSRDKILNVLSTSFRKPIIHIDCWFNSPKPSSAPRVRRRILLRAGVLCFGGLGKYGALTGLWQLGSFKLFAPQLKVSSLCSDPVPIGIGMVHYLLWSNLLARVASRIQFSSLNQSTGIGMNRKQQNGVDRGQSVKCPLDSASALRGETSPHTDYELSS